jgi:hypothetical protein
MNWKKCGRKQQGLTEGIMPEIAIRGWRKWRKLQLGNQVSGPRHFEHKPLCREVPQDQLQKASGISGVIPSGFCKGDSFCTP